MWLAIWSSWLWCVEFLLSFFWKRQNLWVLYSLFWDLVCANISWLTMQSEKTRLVIQFFHEVFGWERIFFNSGQVIRVLQAFQVLEDEICVSYWHYFLLVIKSISLSWFCNNVCNLAIRPDFYDCRLVFS